MTRFKDDRVFAEYPEVQQIRYRALARNLRWTEKGSTVLDVGCGKGDLLQFLLDSELYPLCYLGIDPWGPGIEMANKKYGSMGDHIGFDQTSIQELKEMSVIVRPTIYDFAVAMSVFSHRSGWLSEVESLLLDTIDLLYKWCQVGCAITTKSTYKTEARQDEAVFDPMYLFNIGRRVTERVLIDHSYAPYESMLVLFKEKSEFRKLWEEKKGWTE